MTPYEIMLSESQERMLIVTEEGAVEGKYGKWVGLHPNRNGDR